MVDEPAVAMTMMCSSWLLRTDYVRWALAAADMCFKNYALSFMFDNLKSLPLRRGGGLLQKVAIFSAIYLPFMLSPLLLTSSPPFLFRFLRICLGSTWTLSSFMFGRRSDELNLLGFFPSRFPISLL